MKGTLPACLISNCRSRKGVFVGPETALPATCFVIGAALQSLSACRRESCLDPRAAGIELRLLLRNRELANQPLLNRPTKEKTPKAIPARRRTIGKYCDVCDNVSAPKTSATTATVQAIRKTASTRPISRRTLGVILALSSRFLPASSRLLAISSRDLARI